MITIMQDPLNPTRLLVTQTISFYLDKVLKSSLDAELEQLICAQARKDLKSNPEVKKAVAEAASRKLLAMLSIEEKVVEENSNENTGTSTGANSNQSVSEDRSAVSK